MLVELVSEYPYLQSQDQQSSDVFIYNGGGMSIPMALPMDMSTGGSNEANLSSSDTIEAFPIFRFYGPLTNPSLQNVTTAKTLSVNYSLTSPTDYIEIDTINRTVNLCISGSISNGRQYISGDFWTLQVGANIIHLGNTSFNATGKCVITWRDHFIGI